MLMKPMGTPGKCPAHCRPWTQDEEEQLIALYPLMNFAEIATRLNRGEPATRYKARSLQQAGRLPFKHHYFTPEQDKFIRDNRHTLSIRKVATILGKKAGAVAFRIKKMGISYFKCGDLHSRTKYPDSDVALICALRDGDMAFPKIAEKFDIPESTVKSIYYRRLTAADTIAREYLPR
ncbi:TPA: AsnC family protein [Klebsiella oxytoca]|uniref:AsnC family protein n=1 Tax=Klebsiella oxytoca TaxID=571 RepID=A0AAN5RFJ2_KLEOX|nr:AsnC family protein [Klebsiella oxytoca]